MNEEQIYDSLADHQVSEKWEFKDVLKELHLWSERFIDTFKFEIPKPTIGIERLRVGRLGQYRQGHNGLGLRREIIIDKEHLKSCRNSVDWHNVLATELHEILHCWQEIHGKPGKRNYHNREFRRKAAALGLIIDQRGREQFDNSIDSPFFALLKKHGVRIPNVPEPEFTTRRKVASKSKLKLWVCGCRPKPINIRVGVKKVNIRCEDCKCLFEEVKN